MLRKVDLLKPTVLLVAALLATTPSIAMPVPALATEEATEPLKGVVVESVGEGSALAKAGIEPGDVLLSWRRLPNPPANPEGAEGEIASYFDWRWLVLEQAPRGTVLLSGMRADKAETFEVSPGLWRAQVRPFMPRGVLDLYSQGEALRQAGDLSAAREAWMDAIESNELSSRNALEYWMLLQIGEAWSDSQSDDEARAAFNSILDTASSTTVRVETWTKLGRACEKRELFTDARGAYENALDELYRTSFDQSLISTQISMFLARADLSEGRLDSAQRSLESILEKWQQISPSSPGAAKTLDLLGDVVLRRGRLEAAEGYYERALSAWESLAPEGLEVARILHDLGNVAWDRGQLDLAERRYESSFKIKEELAPGSLSAASTLNNLGNIARIRGRMETALEYYLSALEIRETLAPGSTAVAGTLNNLGALYGTQAELKRASIFFEDALEILLGVAPKSLATTNTLNNVGVVARARGDLEKATAYHLRALNIEREQAPESRELARTLNNLGGIAYDRSDFHKSSQLYHQALEVFKKIAPRSIDIANNFNYVGVAAWSLGDLEEAAESFENALSIMEEQAPESIDIAGILTNLGVVWRHRGELSKATVYEHRALKVAEHKAPGGLMVGSILQNLANLSRDSGDLEGAQAFRHRAEDIYERVSPGSQVQADNFYELGIIYREREKLDEALHFFDLALSAAENQLLNLGGTQQDRIGFKAERSDFYRDTLETQLQLVELGDAFQTAERSRALVFLMQLAERDLIFELDIPPQLDQERRRLAAEQDRLLYQLGSLGTGDSELVEKLLSELRLRRDRSQEIEEEIRSRSPKLAALKYLRPLDLDATRAALDPGTLLLSYSLGKDASHVFAVSKESGLTVETLDKGEEALRREVEHFTGLLQELRPATSSTLLNAGERLYRALIEPVADRVAASERLLILPDGPLHVLPFTALVRRAELPGTGERDWHYLVEWKPLHTALSATVFAELKKTRRDPTDTPAAIRVAAFGDPLYPQRLGDRDSETRGDVYLRSASERGFDFEPLPYTRREVERITGLYGDDAVPYLGADATEERAKTVGDGARILHFAAHGFLDDRIPLSSAIALTIPEELDEGRDNGLLQTWEIFERMRLDADLVVLSACGSALGEELSGEGLMGLTRAFQYAGARTVAATLWNVPDHTTAELMVRFYEHLHAGKSKDEALRAAQIELLREPIVIENARGENVEKDASLPYYWAAFQIYGDWQ